MKANEAPEKIILSADRDTQIIYDKWVTKDYTDNIKIEYTRTDAFIEKALDYIENNIYDHYDGDNEYGICDGYVKKEEFIKNFKDYMKG